MSAKTQHGVIQTNRILSPFWYESSTLYIFY